MSEASIASARRREAIQDSAAVGIATIATWSRAMTGCAHELTIPGSAITAFRPRRRSAKLAP